MTTVYDDTPFPLKETWVDSNGVTRRGGGKRKPRKPGSGGKRPGAGRPGGAKTKRNVIKGNMGEQFMADLFEHWKKEGHYAIKAVYDADPKAYLEIVVKAIPKQIKIENEVTIALEGMTDDQLEGEIARLLGETARGLTFEGEAAADPH